MSTSDTLEKPTSVKKKSQHESEHEDHDSSDDDDNDSNNLDSSGLYLIKEEDNEGKDKFSVNDDETKEEFRLDIDGRYPQMRASGTVFNGLTNRFNWVAELQPQGKDKFSGNIFYRDGNAAGFPYLTISIDVKRSKYKEQRTIEVKFIAAGISDRERKYRFKSSHFHKVELEYDRVSDVPAENAVTSFDTCAHPNRPATIKCEQFSIETAYKRAGFEVKKTKGDGIVPIDGAGTNTLWNSTEMHDAMQTYWSRFANKPQWSTWLLLANLHEGGYGGVMFDQIGPNHRQGTAVFENSFISRAPAGEKNPEAWVRRFRFWTAVHEMGHSFNMAHSFQKQLGRSWIPTPNEPEARSFLNYPFRVRGGTPAFFANFENRFSDSEIIFMRHAPSRFVEMGNASWFDNHGFEQATILPNSPFDVQLSVNRPEARFEFLEPVKLEVKLTNNSNEPVLVDKNILSTSEFMTVIIKKDNKPAREWTPFARYLQEPEKIVMHPGQSLYQSLSVSTGLNGWDIAEPGNYSIQLLLMTTESDVVSKPFTLRMLPAQTFEAELCAQDYFSDDVGRILALNGSRVLNTGNDALHDIIDRLPNSMAARHAKVALAIPYARDYKLLTEKNGAMVINTQIAKADEANDLLTTALLTDSSTVAQTIGHIEYKKIMDNSVVFFKQQGDDSTAKKYYDHSFKTLTKRGVPSAVFEHPINDTVNSSQNRSKGKKQTDNVT